MATGTAAEEPEDLSAVVVPDLARSPASPEQHNYLLTAYSDSEQSSL